ncbi:Lipid A export ATP-binding/permease protein MsbA [BD1-7 clade bacterium]|uniref:Lipid A export ATP-binding/permease protein MsbA n=1 Tax=BD1-7 clade bacterium TaxID=2029982 RepID=A0A5S9P2G6_9GAMM|nr:Lipid A export ATP-binding/permease protein MsbA [BD1-7 clade bacterium]CAA0122750.1 Lipid A export ATP-binding/permease protein MsbA [BD1-7 clade bacterium]
MTDKSPKPASSDWQMYKRLITHILPLKWAFAASLFGFVFYAGMDVMAVDIMQYLIDSLGGTVNYEKKTGIITNLLKNYLDLGDKEGVARTVFPIMVIIIAVFRAFGAFVGNFFMKYVGNKVVFELRNLLFEQMVKLPMSYITSHTSGQLVSRITYNVNQVTGAVTNAVTVIFRDGLTVIFLFGYLIYINYKLTATFIIVAPLIAVVVSVVSKRFRRIATRLQRSMGDVNHVINEAVGSTQDMRVYGAQRTEIQRFNNVSGYQLKQSLKMAVTDAAFSPVIQVLLTLAISMLVWMGLNSDIILSMSPGLFVAYLVAAGVLGKPLRQLTSVIGVIQKALAAAQDIFAQLDEEPEEETGTNVMQRVRGDIRFDQVRFQYPGTDTDALKDISFEVKAGQMLALVGGSGGGKSTLAGLLPRFYNPSEGRILIDEIGTDSVTLHSLREQIALVSQNVVLFNDSIHGNIAYGELAEKSREEIERAARLANAHEFIEKLPEGYDTRIGDNGVLLSGGQRQRIAIARAILKDAPILILDEATSALDNESERLIQQALDDVMTDRTTIVIAHRLTTIEKADKILVIDGGQIVESGDHKSLLAEHGRYAALHASSDGAV